MPEPDHTATLSRPLDAADVPAEGVEGRVDASAEERAALARRFDLAALDSLALDYKLMPSGKGRFRLTGHWSAAATQTCGVTLEPIAHAFDEAVDVEFWPPEVWDRHISSSGEIAVDPEAEMPELIEDGVIDPGHLLEELLVVSLPPFPRRDNAELEWHETDTKAERPFDVLRHLPGRKRG